MCPRSWSNYLLYSKKYCSRAHNKTPQTSHSTKMSHCRPNLSGNGLYCHGNIHHGHGPRYPVNATAPWYDASLGGSLCDTSKSTYDKCNWQVTSQKPLQNSYSSFGKSKAICKFSGLTNDGFQTLIFKVHCQSNSISGIVDSSPFSQFTIEVRCTHQSIANHWTS